jgi:hypothetical protein
VAPLRENPLVFFVGALILSLAASLLLAAGSATAAAPVVSIDAPGSPTYTTVPVSGTVDPQDQETYYSFEYSTDGTTWSGFTFLGPISAGAGSTPVSTELTGLQAGTTYQVRLAATNFVDGEVFSAEPNPTFTTDTLPNPTVSIDPPTVTATGVQLSGVIDPEAPAGNPSASDVNWRFECQPGCPGVEGSIPADSSSHVVSGEATGLKPNTEYEVTLVAVNANGPTSSAAEHFTTGAAEPVVRTLPGFAMRGGTRALMGGLVNPQNSETNYWIEYGLDESYGRSAPVTEDAIAGSGGDPVLVSQVVTGLQPLTTYHYRLVASNSAGTVEGDDQTVTTALVVSESSLGRSSLPDGRVWEMVSPPDKNNGDIFPGFAWASASGDAVAFKAQASFAGQPTSRAGLVSDYISRRGADSWTTTGITPPNGNFNTGAGQFGFTEDLAKGFLVQNLKPGDAGLDPEHPAEQTPGLLMYLNWYLRDNVNNSYRLVSPILPGNRNGARFSGGSADYSHLALSSRRHLTADSPCAESVGAEDGESVPDCAYEFVNGALRLASVLPGEVPGFGLANGITADGRHFFFSGEEHIYDRVDGSSTTQVDVSERTLPAAVPTGPATYLRPTFANAADKVLFSTSRDLVDADENAGEDLYLYDGSKPTGSRLTLISNGDVPAAQTEGLGMLLASESLDRVYFVTSNQLLSSGSQEPGRHIYVWEADGGQGTVREVATVSSEDLLTPASNADLQPVSISVSPNGRFLLFISKAPLTSYDNAGTDQAYRYDEANGELVCVSCRPDGKPGSTAATLEQFGDGFPTEHHLRNVQNDGGVIFQTLEPLGLRDSNGLRDVYKYENGVASLISSGTGGAGSWFVDASVSGNDIFFATRDRLVGWDKDDNYDVYDARVGGGLPEPPPPIVGCDGDSCQPPPNPPNDSTPASASFQGAGNVKPAAKKKRHSKKKKHRKHRKKKSTKQRKSSSKRSGVDTTRKHR